MELKVFYFIFNFYFSETVPILKFSTKRQIQQHFVQKTKRKQDLQTFFSIALTEFSSLSFLQWWWLFSSSNLLVWFAIFSSFLETENGGVLDLDPRLVLSSPSLYLCFFFASETREKRKRKLFFIIGIRDRTYRVDTDTFTYFSRVLAAAVHSLEYSTKRFFFILLLLFFCIVL